ncbi:hypothetical protein B9G39_23250 [Zooshikella ganghwensis]|uniref:Aromatic amino acid permease n=2 Tax=Zooshikella ganghwensis TaxID=202772 RepID=A0A4P9VTD9_9GAMM|nr:hypothetical protein B9G39_23250 [Zooshikella ganghwensis]
MVMRNKKLGSALILAGTAIGAGMLALPLSSSSLGFPLMIALMVLFWGLMFYTAMLIMEVNLAIEPGSTLFTMAHRTLGKPGKIVASIATLFLFYALLSAYITGGSSLLNSYLSSLLGKPLSQVHTTLCFTVIAGGLVYWSTRTVDFVNRLLFLGKIAIFLTIVAFLLPEVNQQHLTEMPVNNGLMLAAMPIVFTSFGFHGSVTSVIAYQGSDVKSLRNIILLGSLLPLLVYFAWEIVTLGVLPATAIGAIVQDGGSVPEMISALGSQIPKTPWISTGLNIFSNIALLTSFLGVALGLFDFIADARDHGDCRRGRLVTAMYTFIPPLIFALFYPKGFIMALGFAALALAVLGVILPVLMAWKVRQNANESQYQVFGGMPLLMIAMLLAMLIICIELASTVGIIEGI